MTENTPPSFAAFPKTKYKMISKALHPNDKVRVTENLFDPHALLLSVTGDSLGRIITFEEYCDYIKREFDGRDTPEERRKHFSQVEKTIQGDSAFLVRIEYFAPVTDGTSPRLLDDIAVIPVQYLEKVE